MFKWSKIRDLWCLTKTKQSAKENQDKIENKMYTLKITNRRLVKLFDSTTFTKDVLKNIIFSGTKISLSNF